MQTKYSEFHDEAFAGMKADARFDEVETHVAQADIEFGMGVVKHLGQARSVRPPRRNQAVLTFSADLVTSNKINGKVNGVAMAEVTFAVSDTNTLGLIATAIAAMAGVKSATAGTHKVTVVMNDNTSGTVTDFVVTLGGSQATASVAYSSLDTFRGIALHRHKEMTTAGTVKFNQYDSVPVLRKGQAWVPVSHDVSEDEDAYLDCGVGMEGLYTNQATSDAGATTNIKTGGKFRRDSIVTAIAGFKLSKVDELLV